MLKSTPPVTIFRDSLDFFQCHSDVILDRPSAPGLDTGWHYRLKNAAHRVGLIPSLVPLSRQALDLQLIRRAVLMRRGELALVRGITISRDRDGGISSARPDERILAHLVRGAVRGLLIGLGVHSGNTTFVFPVRAAILSMQVSNRRAGNAGIPGAFVEG